MAKLLQSEVLLLSEHCSQLFMQQVASTMPVCCALTSMLS